MLFAGALGVIRRAMQGTRRAKLARLLERRAPKVTALAPADKTAKIVWAMMVSGERFQELAALTALRKRAP